MWTSAVQFSDTESVDSDTMWRLTKESEIWHTHEWVTPLRKLHNHSAGAGKQLFPPLFLWVFLTCFHLRVRKGEFGPPSLAGLSHRFQPAIRVRVSSVSVVAVSAGLFRLGIYFLWQVGSIRAESFCFSPRRHFVTSCLQHGTCFFVP